MYEAVDIERIAGAALLGSAILVTGLGYAIFLALARLRGASRLRRIFNGVSLCSYALLVASVIAFSFVMNFTGWWFVLSGLMMCGYFVAPRFIWRLTEDMHQGEGETRPAEPSEPERDSN